MEGRSDRDGVGRHRRENDQAEEAHQEQQFGQIEAEQTSDGCREDIRSIGDRTVAFCAGKRREHRRLCGLIISRADDVMILGHDLAVADSLVSVPSEPFSLVLLKRCANRSPESLKKWSRS